MESSQVLAERRIAMERDGVEGRQEVALQIGYPRWSEGGDEAVCPIAISGLYEMLPPARGRDFFEALINAVRTLRQHCRKPAEGVRFFYLFPPPHDRQPYGGEPLDEEESAAAMRDFLSCYRKDWPVLVERKILMQRDGSEERSEVILQIGQPYWIARGKVEMATCPIAIKGEDIDWVDHYDGDDLFEALSNAARQMNQLFGPSRRGRSFFWPDGQPYKGDYPILLPRRSRKRDPRGIAGNWQVLAERTLLMERDGDTGRTQIAIRIGQPYWTEVGKWAACPLAIDGLYGNLGPMSGRDSYEALISALEFFDRYTRKTDPATAFFWPDERRYFWPDGTPYEGEPLYLEPAPEADSGRR
jgi:hypothetical protein